jgi:hypothetical protein
MMEFPFVDAALHPRGLGFREIEQREAAFDEMCPPEEDDEGTQVGPEEPSPPPPATHLMLYPRATHMWLYGPFRHVCEAWLRWLVAQGAAAPGLPSVWELPAHGKWGSPGRRNGEESNMLVADVVRWRVSFGAYTYDGALRELQELQVAVEESK